MTELKTFTRWADWEQAVLSRVNEPEKCQQLIRQRQQAVDDDATEAKLVAAEFWQEIQRRGFDPDTACVFVPARIASQLLKKVTGVSRATNYATRYLRMLKVKELTRTEKDSMPGWRWRGSKADEEQTMSWLDPELRPSKKGAPVRSPSQRRPAAKRKRRRQTASRAGRAATGTQRSTKGAKKARMPRQRIEGLKSRVKRGPRGQR
jgi:hypothetical protein